MRCADDLILFARSYEEAVHMLDTLVVELQRFGLQLNANKTKVIAMNMGDDSSDFLQTQAGPVKILGSTDSHKYLGKVLPGDFKMRAQAAVSGRISCAWIKFNLFYKTLTSKHITVKLRFKLFEAVVAPTVCYGLATSPLSSKHLAQLDVVRNKMIRKMVGWPHLDEAAWHEIGHCVKHKVEIALSHQPLSIWSERVLTERSKIMNKILLSDNHELQHLVFKWLPSRDVDNNVFPWRRPGRPNVRWTDILIEQ